MADSFQQQVQQQQSKEQQPLSGAEAQVIQQQKAVEQAEAQTGTAPIPRTEATADTTATDPRFDKVCMMIPISVFH